MILTLIDWIRHRVRLRRWNANLAWGRRGEDLAHRYLIAKHYVIVSRNYATRSLSGEIDLVAWDGPVLVFVEVKTRATGDFGEPDRAVDHEKQHRLRVAARDYSRRSAVSYEETRFDVVNIVLKPSLKLTLLRDAFDK